MRRLHRVGVRQSSEIARLGLERYVLDRATNDLVTVLVMYEDDPAWPTLADAVARWDCLDIPSLEFSATEVDAATWLRLDPARHLGFPQHVAGGTWHSTYASWCDACGVSGPQVRPFRMKGEPRWGRDGIMQLNWVFGEYFCRPEVFRDVFAPLGLAARPVESTRGRQLETVVQLDVTEAVDVPTAGYDRVVCDACGVVKVVPERSRTLPPPPAATTAPMVRTESWFGTDSVAYRPIVIGADVWRSMISHKVKGCLVQPCM